MPVIAFLIGISVVTAIGLLTTRLVEGNHPVLSRLESLAVGFATGVTMTMFLAFLLHVTIGIPFSRWGFLVPQLILLGGLMGWSWKKGCLPQLSKLSWKPTFLTAQNSKLINATIIILGLWIIVKIAIGTYMLIASPVFQDDVFNNWNLRGKMFFVHEELVLDIPHGNERSDSQGVSSYPPTVSLFKTYLATLNGKWNDGLAAAPHILWYFSALILVYATLVRLLRKRWAMLGTYILASLPLYLMHGIVPYADAFMSVHVFMAIMYLFASTTTEHSAAFLRLSALATGLLIFTKNEALLLYLPPLLFLLVATLLIRRTNRKELLRTLGQYGVCIAIIALPWLLYKVNNGLPFGNAKPIGDTQLVWQPNVFLSILINTFLEGNWIFLYVLLFTLLIVCYKKAFRSSLLILTSFCLVVYGAQMFLFLFTGLSTEALRQTGQARGLIQLTPVIVVLVTVLLEDLWRRLHKNETS